MRDNGRKGITNGVVLILMILVIAVPSTVYLAYFNKPITTTPATSTSSSTSSVSTSSVSGPEVGFIAGGVTCGYGLTYGSPGGEGCIIYLLNNSTATATPTGSCDLTYSGSNYTGIFSYSDALAPGASTGKVTCGESPEGPDALAGTAVSGEIYFTNGGYVPFNATSKT